MIEEDRHEFSPHPWGWTERSHARHHRHRVFPTPVGMDLTALAYEIEQLRFPHTRGDGPLDITYQGGIG